MPTEKIEEIKIDAPPAPVTSNDNLKDLIEKNIRWSQANYEISKKINRKLFMLLLGGYLKLILILIPVILGIIFLPPLLKDVFNQYKGLLGNTGSTSSNLNSIVSQLNGGQVQELIKLLGK